MGERGFEVDHSTVYHWVNKTDAFSYESFFEENDTKISLSGRTRSS
jgi:transposase-like protein